MQYTKDTYRGLSSTTLNQTSTVIRVLLFGMAASRFVSITKVNYTTIINWHTSRILSSR